MLTSSTRESIFKLSPSLRFSVLAAISLLVWWSPLISSFAFGFILLVAAVVAAVAARLQILPLRRDAQLTVDMLELVVWWIGAFIVSFDTRAFQRALVPLCFLFWIVPIPELVPNPIVRLLQEA